MGRPFIKPALALAFVLLPQLAARVVACSCLPIPTPYKAFADARAVFAGTVVGRRDVPVAEGLTEHFFRFAVGEAFKGVSGKEVEVSAGADSSCYAGFDVGQTYLVYASGSRGDALYSHMCSRTGPLGHAEDEVRLLRALLGGEPEPRVYGVVARFDRELRGGRLLSLSTPLAGIKVVVEGEGRRYEAVTDAGGRFSLAKIPDGHYKARAVVPAPYALHYPVEEEFILGGGSGSDSSMVYAGPAAYARFNLGWKNEVGGRLLDAEGAPLVRAKAALFVLDAAGSPVLVEEKMFDLAEGKYRFHGLTPGRYLPAVTVRLPTAAGPREARFFHPGTGGATRADEVTIDEATASSDRDIKLPEGYVTRGIEGVVVWSDGSPVRGAWVALRGSERPGEDDAPYSFVRADGRGRFSAQAFVGSEYWAHASPTIGDVKLDDGRSLWDAGVRELRASPVRITVGRENAPLRLVLSLPEGLRLSPADNRQEKQR